MTPELKTACEVVFQEHKTSGEPVNWHKDAFRGRLSFGLAALAKQTLERRNIICSRNPIKKTFTVLNPAAAGAASFEEAEEMIQNKIPVLAVAKKDNKPDYVMHHVPGVIKSVEEDENRFAKNATKSITTSLHTSWWMKPFFQYIILPAGAAIAGGLITYLLGLLI